MSRAQVELLIKLAIAPSKMRFFFNVMNLIDLIAITPFYILLIADSTIEPICRSGECAHTLAAVRTWCF